jgi:hypothetical protein
MKSELSVMTLSDFDHMRAGITLGTVYDSAKEQMYISICLQDSLGYAMSDRDIHIAVNDVPKFISLLQEKYDKFKEAGE